jgi:hypothetical protein
VAGAYPTRRAWTAAILALAPVWAAACQVSAGLGTAGGWDRDVSDQRDQWGAYHPQEAYAVTRDVFVLDVPDRTNGPALVPDVEADLPPGTFRGPTSIPDFQTDPGQWRGVRGIVPAGTRIRADTLRAKGNLRDANVRRVYVKARVTDGEFRGLAVDLQAVSIYRADPDGGPVTLVGPNADFLRELR